MTWNPLDPQPRPRPDKTPDPAARQRRTDAVKAAITWTFRVLMLATIGYFVYVRNPGPADTPSSTRSAGQAYGRALAQTYADGLDAYLSAIAAGTPESDAQAALQARWTEGRIAKHRETIQPVLNAIRPAGSEWTGDDQKQRYRDAIRGIQEGLRAVR